MKMINIGKEFNRRLVNRNEWLGDGKFNAVYFRKQFLIEITI